MILAWLLLLTGLTISAVAIYYSVVGLTAIFSAAVIPIVVMGSALEIAKLVCASWLKANWEKIPRFMKLYMSVAVVVLMLITSMGIFGFLSKAHNDQNLVSGDVQSKIAIYDEKIKTAKDNIEADRKQLKQMDEAVDQVMGRSSDEKGADKAVAIRRSQAKDRAALAKDIEANQKIISTLNDEAAPIRAEVRKVEAEVGPIKYIAKFLYGEHGADENMLEQAVTWIIILIVVVFDPLAVIMLLGAQMTFGWKREDTEPASISDFAPQPQEYIPEEEQETINSPEFVEPTEELEVHPDEGTAEPVTVTEHVPPKATLLSDFLDEPMHQFVQAPAKPEPEVPNTSESELDKWNKMVEEAEKAIQEEQTRQEVKAELDRGEELIQAEETATVTTEDHLSEVTGDRDDSKKKTYMTKDEKGLIQIKEVK